MMKRAHIILLLLAFCIRTMAADYITKPFNFDLPNLRIYNLIKWRHATPIGQKIESEIKQVEVTSAGGQGDEEAEEE